MGPRDITTKHALSLALRERRVDKSLTQADLAEEAGLSLRTVIRAERLGADGDLATGSLLALSRALDLRITVSPATDDDRIPGLPDERYQW